MLAAVWQRSQLSLYGVRADAVAKAEAGGVLIQLPEDVVAAPEPSLDTTWETVHAAQIPPRHPSDQRRTAATASTDAIAPRGPLARTLAPCPAAIGSTSAS